MECKKVLNINSVIFFGLVLWLTAMGTVQGQTRGSGGDPTGEGLADQAQLFEGYLYFADADGSHLKAQPKQFSSGLDAHELGLAILEALMAGPSIPGLTPTFPVGTQVNTLFITKGNDAYVDLKLAHGHFKQADTVTELLGIYSLVNSLTLNIPGISRVKILVNGTDGASFGNHLSLNTFFKTNMLIVK